MIINIITSMPDIMNAVHNGILGHAIKRKIITLNIIPLRDFSDRNDKRIDDRPYGGGPGMVLKPEPIFKAVEQCQAQKDSQGHVVLLSPQGRRFDQNTAKELSLNDHLILICGRYEGVDERVYEEVVTEEISIGDYVVTGGELPAMVIIDAVGRHVPGVVGDAASVESDSFVRSLLDWPHYTRPAKLGNHEVPEVLLSGNHLEIQRWRKRAALRRTLQRRPELLGGAQGMDDEEREVLQELQRNEEVRKAGA